MVLRMIFDAVIDAAASKWYCGMIVDAVHVYFNIAVKCEVEVIAPRGVRFPWQRPRRA